jgi:hypothetical protein
MVGTDAFNTLVAWMRALGDALAGSRATRGRLQGRRSSGAKPISGCGVTTTVRV